MGSDCLQKPNPRRSPLRSMMALQTSCVARAFCFPSLNKTRVLLSCCVLGRSWEPVAPYAYPVVEERRETSPPRFVTAMRTNLSSPSPLLGCIPTRRTSSWGGKTRISSRKHPSPRPLRDKTQSASNLYVRNSIPLVIPLPTSPPTP